MLLHLPSNGVLYFCWDRQGKSIVEANFKTFPELDNDEWVEVRGRTLKKRANMYYPNFKPVMIDGELVDIILPQKEKCVDDVELKRKDLEEAGWSGYYFRRELKTDVFDFASDIMRQRGLDVSNEFL